MGYASEAEHVLPERLRAAGFPSKGRRARSETISRHGSGSLDSHLRLARLGQDDIREGTRAESAGRAPLPRRVEARSRHRLLRRTAARAAGASTLAARPRTTHAGPECDLGERLLVARGAG